VTTAAIAINCAANLPQAEFLNLPHRFCAFVGGFGSGKTHALAMGLVRNKWEAPKVLTSYYAPTYKHVRDIFYPKIEAVAQSLALKVKIKTGDAEVHYYNGRQYRGTTLCRTMDNPQSIVGTEAGRIAIDELDLLSVDKATIAWNKIIGRARSKGIRNRVDVGTTPEGFKFTYRRFVVEGGGDYGRVHASTYDNEMNLPPEYIPSLINTYPAYLIKAYLNGEFTNLVSGTVYRQFSRSVHASAETYKEGEPLLIGQDFNVGNMASAICANRAGKYHVIAELTGVMDTLHLCNVLRERYPKSEMTIFPDATGKARNTTDATKNDIQILRSTGFRVVTNESNPAVKDRVLAVNTAFEKGNLFVNVTACPNLTTSLEQQAYDANGQPDKQSGFDHLNDALGYMAIKKLPVVRPTYIGVIR
jgi:hypothetical protein